MKNSVISSCLVAVAAHAATPLLHRFRHQRADDCLILTLACGKYCLSKPEFGDLEGLPRLVDAGQCNDAYWRIFLAVALAEKLGCGVNNLPLSLVLYCV
ncbi:hypothetical protein ACNKHT_05560 [Shigella flexneri]